MIKTLNVIRLIGISFLIIFSGFSFANSLPELVSNNNRHALMVDGAPFLILGAQTNNSSNYPAALKDVWPSVKKMHAIL